MASGEIWEDSSGYSRFSLCFHREFGEEFRDGRRVFVRNLEGKDGPIQHMYIQEAEHITHYAVFAGIGKVFVDRYYANANDPEDGRENWMVVYERDESGIYRTKSVPASNLVYWDGNVIGFTPYNEEVNGLGYLSYAFEEAFLGDMLSLARGERDNQSGVVFSDCTVVFGSPYLEA